MPKIGNRAHAQEIHDWFRAERAAGRYNRSAPEGWERLGNGSYRTAFRHIETNVLYKVEHYNDDSDGYGSSTEVRTAQRLWAKTNGTGILGTKVRIPKVSGFRFGGWVVVAMEVVTRAVANDYSSPTPQCADGRWELFSLCKFQDMHWENYFIDENGYAVPIDMASPRMRSTWSADNRVLLGTPQYTEESERRKKRFGWC